MKSTRSWGNAQPCDCLTLTQSQSATGEHNIITAMTFDSACAIFPLTVIVLHFFFAAAQVYHQIGGSDDGEGIEGGGGGDGGGSERRSGAGDTLYHYKGNKKEYCDKFGVNYEYYCSGDSTNPEITAKFCPAYKAACRSEQQNAPPPSPFTGKNQKSTNTQGVDENFPDFNDPKQTRTSRRKKKQQKKRPCTPDCDPRIYPHCTKECKCDYDYPHVQKFCNPPPLPFFLNTCRLWYAGCPKYEQYHYASQFVYSKAEKGKRVEGPQDQKPFSVISPNGERIPVNTRTAGTSPVARDDPLPDSAEWYSSMLVDQADSEVKEASHNITDNYRRLDIPEWPSKAKNESLPLSHRDEAAEPDEGKADSNARAKDTPVVPSDSVFSNALQQYGAFTDNRGILHRPRSRSPFTKPGLWEPNPDNPHNRDIANKWFYYPRSVTVDWLNGQLAWGAHWAVPAAGVGGTDGFSTVHFPTVGTFLNIPDDYD